MTTHESNSSIYAHVMHAAGSCLGHPNKPQWSNCRLVLAMQEAVNLCIDVKKLKDTHLECRLFRLLLSLFLAESICHGVVRLHCEHLRPLISADVDGVNEGFVDALQHAYAGVDSHALHFVDASEGDTVTRLGHVHKVVMRKQGH